MSRPPGDTTVVEGTTRGVSRFYWGWLTFATSVSVLGNVTHALLVAPDAVRLLAAVASVVPPAFVLGSTHSVALSLRTRRFALTYILGLSMTIGVAACAFFLSFDALRALAVILGWPPARAWLFPVAVDVSIAQATFGLLSPAPPATKPARFQVTSDEDQTTGTSPLSVSTQAGKHVARNSAIEGAGCGPEVIKSVPALLVSESKPVGTAIAAVPDTPVDTTEIARWKPTAHQLVHNGTTSKHPEIVAAILAEHAAGTPPSTISRRRGVHHSTVGRILAAAADITR